MIKLPFKLQLNAPISKVLKRTQDPIRFDKQIIFGLNQLYKQRLRTAFHSIKTCQLQSSNSYFKSILAIAKQNQKQSKISYPNYNHQLPFVHSQVPKTPIFNLRIKSVKNNAFLQLKQYFFDLKSFQLSTILQNRQSQLLNHLIPKIQQKIYTIAFRTIADYAREQKGKNKIVRLMDKFVKNIAKRVYFSEFFNKLKKIRSKEDKKKLACQKMTKIQKLSQRYVKENAFRKIQLYIQSLSLQEKLSQKRQRISKIHDINSERTVMIQKQRETLRNLKSKLDQESIEKNHILTQKRRSLMLARTKFTQESKQLTDQILTLSAEVYKLSTFYQKQSHILLSLEQKKNCLKELKRRGIDFQSITITVYKAIHDVGEEGLNGFYQIVKHHEQKWNHVQNMVLFENVQNERDYQCRKISFLERLIRAYERKENQSEINASRFKPLGSTLSTSQLKFSPSSSTLKGSRVVNGPFNPKSRTYADPAELTRLKEEYSTLQSLISLILSKSYEIKIKQAISEQIQQLSELLASDLKENQNQE